MRAKVFQASMLEIRTLRIALADSFDLRRVQDFCSSHIPDPLFGFWKSGIEKREKSRHHFSQSPMLKPQRQKKAPISFEIEAFWFARRDLTPHAWSEHQNLNLRKTVPVRTAPCRRVPRRALIFQACPAIMFENPAPRLMQTISSLLDVLRHTSAKSVLVTGWRYASLRAVLSVNHPLLFPGFLSVIHVGIRFSHA